MAYNAKTQTFDTFDDLRLLPGISNATAYVLGNSSVNDGDGGEFYWDDTSTDTDDDETVIQVTGVVTGRWVRVLENSTDTRTETASYTLQLIDAGDTVRMNVGSANDLTVPTNASVPFRIGTTIIVRQIGTGATTIVASGGVTINATSLVIGTQYLSVALVKVGTNEWDLYTGGGTGGGGTPGGSDTYVQFNDSSAFGGDAGLTYVKATDTLTVAGVVITPSLKGGTSSGGDLTLDSTSHATKGRIIFGSTSSAYYDQPTAALNLLGTFIVGAGSSNSVVQITNSANTAGSAQLKFTQNDGTILGQITGYDASGGTTVAGIDFSSKIVLAGNDDGIVLYSGTSHPIHFITNTTSPVLTLTTGGKVGLNGVTVPTAYLHLPVGTATANTAPIKLATGTALTTPEDGAIEYHTSHLYFTIGSTRYQLDQQSGLKFGASGEDTTATADREFSTTGYIMRITGETTYRHGLHVRNSGGVASANTTIGDSNSTDVGTDGGGTTRMRIDHVGTAGGTPQSTATFTLANAEKLVMDGLLDSFTSTFANVYLDGIGNSPQSYVLYYNTGTKKVTYGLGSSAGSTWTEVTGTTQAAAVANNYITNNVALVTVTLPASAVVGDVIEIVGKGAGGWKLAQNSGQTIYFGSAATTTGTGGFLSSSNRRDVVKIVCVTANNDFSVIHSIGNINVT